MQYVDKSFSEFKTKEVAGGKLACAKVVTWILKEAGLIDFIEVSVDKTVERLKSKGWTEQKTPHIGGVVVWDKTSKIPNKHIGIIIEENKAINNSSRELKPVITSIHNEERPVVAFLRPPEDKKIITRKVQVTSYNPEVGQNDSTPCIAAGGHDICKLAKEGKKMIAVSRDLRPLFLEKKGQYFKYPAQVYVDSPNPSIQGCYWIYDTMNARWKNRIDLFFMTRKENQGDMKWQTKITNDLTKCKNE